jgi:hypothetical protein
MTDRLRSESPLITTGECFMGIFVSKRESWIVR